METIKRTVLFWAAFFEIADIILIVDKLSIARGHWRTADTAQECYGLSTTDY